MAQNKTINGTALTTLKSKKPLCEHTEDALDSYFASLNGDRPGDLYDLVLGEVERPLFKAVMDRQRTYSVSIGARYARNFEPIP